MSEENLNETIEKIQAPEPPKLDPRVFSEKYDFNLPRPREL